MELSLPPTTRYDIAARYLLLKAGALLLSWLLSKTSLQVRFERWLPTVLTLPGVPQRVCDGIAHLVDLERKGVPCAGILEVQTTPDATMTGRLLLAGGLVWLTLKPTPLPGDRFLLVALVINLTGQGDSAHRCVLGAAEWLVQPIEVNLETLDAGAVLDQIQGGTAPRELLAFIPLMQRGDDSAMIQRWQNIVAAEADLIRRGDYALARIFAERVNRVEAWHNALEGFSMIESPIIAELLAENTRTAKAEFLLMAIQERFGEQPEDLARAIRACADGEQLARWMRLAVRTQTLEAFRQQTGL